MGRWQCTGYGSGGTRGRCTLAIGNRLSTPMSVVLVGLSLLDCVWRLVMSDGGCRLFAGAEVAVVARRMRYEYRYVADICSLFFV